VARDFQFLLDSDGGGRRGGHKKTSPSAFDTETKGQTLE